MPQFWVDPLVYPAPANAIPISYLGNGLTTTVPCVLDGVTNRLKVYVSTGAATRDVILLFARNRLDIHILSSRAHPPLGLKNGPTI